ncbi:NUDIX hydrolase [Pseudactinotalea sp.]|uniref:NUDIX hydrolase n=1 Tax=Pseudactinotalea sp. TaxID=1926260 RepID=UPI003B3A3E77
MPDAELWDVTDEHGNLTGEVYHRGDPDWPEGRYHLIVAVCGILPDGRMLLTQRAASKIYAFSWEFPGGSAFAGETSAQAAAREFREETGLTVDLPDLELVGRFTEESALLDMYLVRFTHTPLVTPEPSEVHAAEWVAPEELQRRLAAGELAAPWTDRLAALWPAITDALTPTA